MGATIKRRPRGESTLSDACCTPEWLTERLPLVDIDPCSNPRTTVRARWAYSLEKGLDGLKLPWAGSVFMNWPYSYPLPWAAKFIAEWQLGRCTEGILLVKLDPTPMWWRALSTFGATLTQDETLDPSYPAWSHEFAPRLGRLDLWLFEDRLQFDEPPELVELRRQKVIEKTIERARARGKEPKITDKLGRSSTNNFASAILHFHKQPTRSTLALDDVAELWVPDRRLVA